MSEASKVVRCPGCKQIDFRAEGAYNELKHANEMQGVEWDGEMEVICLACDTKFSIKRVSLWTITKE